MSRFKRSVCGEVRVPLTLLFTSVLIIGLFVANHSAAQDTAQDKVFSGPQPGEKLTPFKVVQVKGEKAVEKEIVGKSENDCTIICFAHKVSEAAIGLMIFLETYASQQDTIEDHYVWLTENPAEMQQNVRRWNFFQDAPVSISVDGIEGPGEYGLNRNVTMTVLVAKKDNTVVASFALEDPNQRDSDKILKEVAKVIGKDAPSYEQIREQLNERRRMRRDRRLRENPIFKLAPNDELGKMMVNMMGGEGSRERIARRQSEAMIKWVGDSAERKAALKKYCQAVLDGDFEMNEYAEAALKKIVKDD